MDDVTKVRSTLMKSWRQQLSFIEAVESCSALYRIVSGQRLIATTPHNILAMTTCEGMLVVCTEKGVFSGLPTGPLHEVKFLPNPTN